MDPVNLLRSEFFYIISLMSLSLYPFFFYSLSIEFLLSIVPFELLIEFSYLLIYSTLKKFFVFFFLFLLFKGFWASSLISLYLLLILKNFNVHDLILILFLKRFLFL